MKKIIMFVTCLAVAFVLSACGTKPSNTQGTKPEENTNTKVDTTDFEEEPTQEPATEEATTAQPSEPQTGSGETVAYYKTITCSADAIYYIFEDMRHFEGNDVPAGSISGEPVRLHLNYDSSTGELLSASVDMYVELSSEGAEDDDLISAIRKTDYSNYFLNYQKKVIEKHEDDTPYIVKITATLGDLREMIDEGMGCSLEQYVDSYLIWKQDLETLTESLTDYQNNGLTVEQGNNYIVDPLSGIRYEWSR